MNTSQYAAGSPADDEGRHDAQVDAWAKRLREEHGDGWQAEMTASLLEYKYSEAEATAEVAASAARIALDSRDDGIGEISQGSPERETGQYTPWYDAAGRLSVDVHDRNPIDPARDAVRHLLEHNEPPRLFSIGPDAAAVITKNGQIRPLTPEDWLTRVADHVTFMGMSKAGPVIVAPPAPVMRMVPPLLIPQLPPLDGVTTTPYLDPDGNLVSDDGYCPGTRLVLRQGDLVLPPVPDVPSESEVAAAGRLLTDEWLGDFPFTDDAGQAAAVACLLTLTGRSFFALAPMFVADASVPGSGKGLFVGTLAQIATGEPPRFMELPADREEQRKKITTALLEGQTLIAWDESHVIGGRSLAMVLTAERYSDRILGGNKMMSVDNRFTQVALGNNVLVLGDMKRRVVPFRLVPPDEHPEHRKDFRHDDLTAWVRQNRGELLRATLVIWRNWVARGRPEAGVTMGSFERWARAVGGALEAAGIEGFLSNTAGWLDDSDDGLAEWAEHLAVLHAVFAGNKFTAKDVVRKGIELPSFWRNRDEPEDKQLGYQYRSIKDRWLDDRRLVKAGTEHGRTTWGVEDRTVPPRGGFEYISPISPTHPQNPGSRNPGAQKGEIDAMGEMVQMPQREYPLEWARWWDVADHTAKGGS